MTIRPLRQTDRDELLRMRLALWPDSSEEEAESTLDIPVSEGLVLVAEHDDGALIAFAELGVRKFADGCRTSPVAYLEGIWVDPNHRRRGIASQLVRRAEVWARSLGLSEFASDCDIGNNESLAFHLAAGFAEVQRSIAFRRELAP